MAAIEPGQHHWQTLTRLLLRNGTAANLTNEAHIAAIAIDNASIVYSADNDFKRFEGVQHYNPLLESDEVHEPMLSYSR